MPTTERRVRRPLCLTFLDSSGLRLLIRLRNGALRTGERFDWDAVAARV